MAYLRELGQPCAHCCSRRATVELLNRRNEIMGAFCRNCGRIRLRQLQQNEARIDAARGADSGAGKVKSR